MTVNLVDVKASVITQDNSAKPPLKTGENTQHRLKAAAQSMGAPLILQGQTVNLVAHLEASTPNH